MKEINPTLPPGDCRVVDYSRGAVPNIPRFLFCLFILTAQLTFSAENKQERYAAARQRALEATDIFSAGPVQIRATFHLHAPAGQVDGTYQYSQLSKDEYREEVQIPDFSESIVYRRGELYFVSSKQFEPLPMWYLRYLIYRSQRILDIAPFSKVNTSVQNRHNVTCYIVERRPSTPELDPFTECFDADNGVLASSEESFNVEVDRFEYSNFLHADKKLFPGAMRMLHNGSLLAEVTVDSVSHAPTDAKLLDPPPNASKQGVCQRFQRAEITGYSEEYVPIIRPYYKSGTVIITGSLDDHGKIRETEIQQSANPKADEAALKALKEVQIHPAKCDGHAIASLFRMHIWFSPAPHPDWFESFRWRSLWSQN